jgi:hypothetical protein
MCFPADERGNRVASGSFRPPAKEIQMTKTLLALGAAAVAFTGVASATSADARNRHHSRVCAKWRNHHCVRWDNHGYRMSSARHARWQAGYRFGPRYSYTAYSALPRTYVSRYDLSPRYRYVYSDNYIYQVDPRTYAITRVIDALTR